MQCHTNVTRFQQCHSSIEPARVSPGMPKERTAKVHLTHHAEAMEGKNTTYSLSQNGVGVDVDQKEDTLARPSSEKLGTSSADSVDEIKPHSVPTLNHILGVNLEGLHQPRGCQRSAPHSAQICVPRYFHQLFRQLRLANKSSHWELVNENLGHFDNLLGDPDIVRCKGKSFGVRMICSTVRRFTRSCGPDTSDRRSRLEPPLAGTSSTSMAKYWVRRRVVQLAPPLRSWPSSVPVGWRGAGTWPEAFATGALCDDGHSPFHREPLRCQHP